MIKKLRDIVKEFIITHPEGVIILYGPTATGKSWLSIDLAQIFSSQDKKIEIISADSRQVYREMNIGTDKISQIIRKEIPHYGIDLINPNEQYTAHQRQQESKQWISDIQSRQNIPLIVGWTGLYIDTIYKNFSLPAQVNANRERRAELDALESQQSWYLWKYLDHIDPVSAQNFHPQNTRYIIRAIEIYEQTGIPKSVLAQEHPVDQALLMISLQRDRNQTLQLIRQRVEQMISGWLIEEVKWLLEHWYDATLQSMNGIGYRQTVQWLQEGNNDINQLIETINTASAQYAKRQRTRFRRYEKDAREHPKDNVVYKEIIL